MGCRKTGIKLIFVLGTAVLFLVYPSFKCWVDQGDEVIASSCNSREQTGILCEIICSARSQDCYLFHASKALVRSVQTKEERVVIKQKNIILDKEYVESLLIGDADVSNPLTSFQNLVLGLVSLELSGNASENVLKLLWPWDHSTDLFNGPKWPVLKQILRFAHNDEYKLMQLYRQLRLFPKVLGTCGDIYAVEQVEILLKSPLLDLLPALDGCHAARSAAQILRYLRRLSAALPLHLCDLQWGHFGAARDGALRFVDLDAAFLPARLAATQQATPCAADADCDFFDCRGTCDAARGRCRPGVSDNVSNLCRQLVWPRAALFGARRRLGLLAAVLDTQEAVLLERCADSATDELADQVMQMLDRLEARLCGKGDEHMEL